MLESGTTQPYRLYIVRFFSSCKPSVTHTCNRIECPFGRSPNRLGFELEGLELDNFIFISYKPRNLRSNLDESLMLCVFRPLPSYALR